MGFVSGACEIEIAYERELLIGQMPDQACIGNIFGADVLGYGRVIGHLQCPS
jgi:hypothetical protein